MRRTWADLGGRRGERGTDGSRRGGLALLLLAAAAATAPAAPLAGHWEGAIELPGLSLTIRVDFVEGEGGTWSGSIDIPQQGAAGLPLGDIAVAADSVAFAMPGIPGDPRFSGRFADAGIAGTFTQNGRSFPFHLGRETAPGPVRPQEPAPPFPYRSEELSFASGEIRLAGTLTLPAGEGPFPAALLVSGSGPQNRDEEVFGHKPFLVIADYLTRAGIAVLRVDDRGVGGSGGSLGEATTAELAEDALAAVRTLRARPEIASARVGIIGHSEGGLIGPLAAARSQEVAFVVMLAGPGVPGGEVLRLQSARILAASGATEAEIQAQSEAMAAMLALIEAEADSAALRAKIEELAAAQVAALPDSLRPTGEEVESQLEQQLAAMNQPWFRYFITYDPRPALRQLRVPVLALIGEHDLQVPPDQNLPAIEQALREGGNRDAEVRELPGLNHLFQPSETGNPAEYATIETTFAPAALAALSDWLRARFGAP
ncbi:alpha/beta hydrolase [bacterium]|nr:alpha/beta hydrolase [bacterium]